MRLKTWCEIKQNKTIKSNLEPNRPQYSAGVNLGKTSPRHQSERTRVQHNPVSWFDLHTPSLENEAHGADLQNEMECR